MVPMVTHPGFSNAPGANPAPGPYAVTGPATRPQRRDSNSRNSGPRPSSGSGRFEYSVSRPSHPHAVAPADLVSPATIDVASSTDTNLVAEASVTAELEPAVMPVSHADASTSAVHQPEMSAVLDTMPRRAQTQNWRHSDRDSATSRYVVILSLQKNYIDILQLRLENVLLNINTFEPIRLMKSLFTTTKCVLFLVHFCNHFKISDQIIEQITRVRARLYLDRFATISLFI